MRFIIGTCLFWLSIFGYLLFLNKKTKLPYIFLLPISFSLIGILMFISGILNMMKEFSLIILLVGLIYFFYSLINKKIDYKKIINSDLIIVFLIIIYITIIGSSLHPTHYDNFSHWALIIKTMFSKNALPNFENPVITFKEYQPGSACFIYYFGLLVGKTEGSMIVAQNYLIISFYFSLLFFTNSKSKNTKQNYILKFIVVLCYILFITGNIIIGDLLVDNLIATISICSLAIIYYFRNDLKKAFVYTLPISIYLFLVKNIGLVLLGFNCLALIYYGFKNKKLKDGFIYAILTGIISVIFFYIWSKHVSYVYGNLSRYSKHSLSTANILSELRLKGWSRIFEFCLIYFKHFLDISNHVPNKYMIGINIIFILMYIFYKKDQKKIITSMLLCDFIYLTYYAILGIMYLMSMPWSEAAILAGFERYMLTAVYIIIGLFLICYISVVKKDKKDKNKSIIFGLIFAIFILGLNIKEYKIDYKILLGIQNYETTKAYRFDQILKNDKLLSNSKDYYYIYAPIASSNDNGYINFLSKYKLDTDNCLIINNIDDLNTKLEKNYNNKIIVFDEDEYIYNYLEDNNYKKESDRLYAKYIE